MEVHYFLLGLLAVCIFGGVIIGLVLAWGRLWDDKEPDHGDFY